MDSILKFHREEVNFTVKDLRTRNLKTLVKALINLRFELDFETDSNNCMNFDSYDVKEIEEFRIIEVYVSTTGEKSILVYNHIQSQVKLDLESEESFQKFLEKTLKAVDDVIELDQKARESVRKLREEIKE